MSEQACKFLIINDIFITYGNIEVFILNDVFFKSSFALSKMSDKVHSYNI